MRPLWTVKAPSVWAGFVLFVCIILHGCKGDVRYSIPEEMQRGSVVGKITQDLGIDTKSLSARKPRLDFEGSKRYCEFNSWTGELTVNERMDREVMCGQRPSCAVHFDLFLENPLEFHRITLDTQDINDNSPKFRNDVINLEIQESVGKGARFSIDEAHDADTGVNSVQGYTLSNNEHFSLAVHSSTDRGKYSEIVLENELDREKQDHLSLTLSAYDGGSPKRSGSVIINVKVLDANDNVPVFTQPVYEVSLFENSPLGTIVFQVSASDADEGANGEVTYEFSYISINAENLFSIDPTTGVITVKGTIDFEESSSFELRVKAKDGAGQSASCKVVVEVEDLNDNPPLIVMKSLLSPVPENIPSGTEIGLIYVQDKDSRANGKIKCSIDQHAPLQLVPSVKNHFSLVTTTELDREAQPEYNITLTATDDGSPPLFSSKTFSLSLGDVNDNSPVFEKQYYHANILENNKPGSSLCSVLAKDPDWRQNGTVFYSLVPGEVNSHSVSSFISINGDTGVIHAVRPFDYEQFKSFKVTVVARDNGSPALSSNVTVNIFITDDNDNSPQILYPTLERNSLMTELVPKAAQAGSLVSKVIAVDADSGQNAWLSFSIVKSTDPGLFVIGEHSGEIRTQRDISVTDGMKQNLVVSVRDNGQPPLSATCAVYLVISDNLAEVPEFKDMSLEGNYTKLTFYLIIALVSVSTFFLTFIIITLAMRFCNRRKPRLLFDGPVAIPSTYLPPNYADVDGTGTLRSCYSYDAYLTTGSRTSDFKFVNSYNEGTLPADLTLNESPPAFNHHNTPGNVAELSSPVS
ncbi:protocadherin beta-16-like [Alosa alosa]|uniref:protocadherin beta-16-like n=1 Tax=Alosa alosa TaxID=278164 RepID=UPI00201523C9|nr:protocadherin beta-16-like [Alosa alosa]